MERSVSPMSALGQKRTSPGISRMSALPPKADIGTQSRNVCFVPKADIGSAIRSSRCAHWVHDFRCADDLPRVVSHGRYCQRNRHKTSVFALAHSFKIFDTLAAADSVQNFNFLIQAI